jgi:type II secretory pathway pseudopilin PulG
MFLPLTPKINNRRRLGFTTIEVLIAFAIFTMAIAGLINGYVQSNRTATWSSWSLAAQSIATQGLERERAAQWNEQGNEDQMPTNIINGVVVTPWATPYMDTNCTLDVPSTGGLIYVTNYIYVSTYSSAPPLRLIRSDCIWTFPLTGKLWTNSAISLRAPDQ